MKILAIGDPHFKKDNLYFMNFACKEIISIIDSRKPDLCICLGDTLDTHERIDMRTQNMAGDFFFQIVERCPLIVIIGNHDRENRSVVNEEISCFKLLRKTPNILVVDTAIWDEERNFIYVPYVPPGKFLEELAKVGYHPDSPNNNKIPELIFSHQEFRGSKINTNTFSENGDSWSKDWPLIISGHIHEHQILPKIVYAGTFIQQNYGEGSDKALLMIYHDKEEIEENKRNKIERIPLKSIWSRKTVYLTPEELDSFNEKIPPDSVRSEDLVKEIIHNNTLPKFGTLVRVIIYVDAIEVKKLKLLPSYASLEKIVDKVETPLTGTKAGIASNIIKNIRDKNNETNVETNKENNNETNNEINGENENNKNDVTLEQIIQELLKDDPKTLNVFKDEILNSSEHSSSK